MWRKGHTQMREAKEAESKRQTKATATTKAIEGLEDRGMTKKNYYNAMNDTNPIYTQSETGNDDAKKSCHKHEKKKGKTARSTARSTLA